jgi:biopolymer transport protein ExbB
MKAKSLSLLVLLFPLVFLIPSGLCQEEGELAPLDQEALENTFGDLEEENTVDLYSDLAEETGGEQTAGPTLTLYEIVIKTGYFIVPLGFFSIWALYLILANLFVLSESRLVPNRVGNRLRDVLREGDLDEAEDLVARRRDLISLMVRAGVDKAGRDPGLIETAMEGNISRELVVLRNRIRRLADIGNLAPMLGLLGTVWGMIRVFKGISMNANEMVANWSSQLADGVAQAMLTTVLGLLIGIPSLFFYYIYRNKLAKIIGRLESHGTDLADLLSQQTPRGKTGIGGSEEYR